MNSQNFQDTWTAFIFAVFIFAVFILAVLSSRYYLRGLLFHLYYCSVSHIFFFHWLSAVLPLDTSTQSSRFHIFDNCTCRVECRIVMIVVFVSNCFVILSSFSLILQLNLQITSFIFICELTMFIGLFPSQVFFFLIVLYLDYILLHLDFDHLFPIWSFCFLKFAFVSRNNFKSGRGKPILRSELNGFVHGISDFVVSWRYMFFFLIMSHLDHILLHFDLIIFSKLRSFRR